MPNPEKAAEARKRADVHREKARRFRQAGHNMKAANEEERVRFYERIARENEG